MQYCSTCSKRFVESYIMELKTPKSKHINQTWIKYLTNMQELMNYFKQYKEIFYELILYFKGIDKFSLKIEK